MSENYLDKLHADPAVATCSVLASQLAEKADQLLQLPDSAVTNSKQYIIANEFFVHGQTPTAMHVFGQTAEAGLDLRLAEFKSVRGKPPIKGLYSLLRNNVLLGVASYAINTVGPCNYVQFPGEISEGMVLTPIDEAKKKPLLKEMLGLDTSSQEVDLHANAKSGDGYNLDPYASELLRCIYEYTLCPEEDLLEAGQKVIDACEGNVRFDDNTIVSAAAYATLFGRFDDGPLVHMRDNSYFDFKTNYNDKVHHLRNNPLGSTHYHHEGSGLKIAKHYRSLLLANARSHNILAVPHLETLMLEQYKQVFGIEYDPQQEAILSKLFSLGDIAIKKTIESGYVARDATVTGDVDCELVVTSLDDSSKRNLELFARVSSMRDIPPTHCGALKADKLGALTNIEPNGELMLLTKLQIEKLGEIVLNGEVVESQPAGQRKRGIFSRKPKL